MAVIKSYLHSQKALSFQEVRLIPKQCTHIINGKKQGKLTELSNRYSLNGLSASLGKKQYNYLFSKHIICLLCTQIFPYKNTKTNKINPTIQSRNKTQQKKNPIKFFLMIPVIFLMSFICLREQEIKTYG